MAGLMVGATMFSGSLLFAMTFALPLLFGAGALSMLGFWTFGLVSVAASLALPVFMIAVRVYGGTGAPALADNSHFQRMKLRREEVSSGQQSGLARSSETVLRVRRWPATLSAAVCLSSGCASTSCWSA